MEFYQARVEEYKLILHDRIMWPKGTTYLKVSALKAKLTMIWRSRKCGITSLDNQSNLGI